MSTSSVFRFALLTLITPLMLRFRIQRETLYETCFREI